VTRSFEQTKLGKDAREIVKLVYRLSRKNVFRMDRALADQARRAAISILSNIAEGFERGSNTELIQFLYIAKGSSGELRAQFTVAFDEGYITENEYLQIRQSCIEISSQCSGLIKYLKGTPLKGGKYKDR
jgi:four helix bundle protein